MAGGCFTFEGFALPILLLLALLVASSNKINFASSMSIRGFGLAVTKLCVELLLCAYDDDDFCCCFCSRYLKLFNKSLSTVFYSINSPDNSPFSHSVLPVLSLPYWFFQLYVSL